MPDHFLRDLRSPNHASATNASKNPTACDLGHAQPVVDGLFYPVRHWECADVPSPSDQIKDGPMVLPALDEVQRQIDEFSPAKCTPKHNCQKGTNPIAFDGMHIGKLQQGTC